MLGLRVPYTRMNVIRWYYATGTCGNGLRVPKSTLAHMARLGHWYLRTAYYSLSSVKLAGVSGYNTGGGLSEPNTVG